MPDRHARPSFTIRPPADVRDWLDAHLAVSGAKRNTFISDAIAEKLEREQQMSLVTEKVSENYQPRPGQMDTRHFWIAYPEDVSAYGHMSDRISRATGRGETRQAALADAGYAPDFARKTVSDNPENLDRDPAEDGEDWA